MKKILILFWGLTLAHCLASAQSLVHDPARLYDTLTDNDHYYLFSLPKPCIQPVYYIWAPGHILVQEYTIPDTLTVYGVALTFVNQNPNTVIYDNFTNIKGLLLNRLRPSPITYLGDRYAMDIVDTVTFNLSHPHFCWFKYENDCVGKESLTVPCYELYFDTPGRTNLMSDTFYVGLERYNSEVFLPKYYGGQYNNSLPGHLYWGLGADDVGSTGNYDMMSHLNNASYEKLWGIAFPIIGFRCKPMQQYWLEPYASGTHILRWRNCEEGTTYNVRVVGEDGSDTTMVTIDTMIVIPHLSDSVRYNVMLRKQCHYATSNYDTTVYSDWLSYLHFGTTILPPDTTTRDTVWRTVSAISNNPAWGTVIGAGRYADSSVATLTASPFADCVFDAWSDGNTYNPRLVYVVSDTTLTALFHSTADTTADTTEAISGSPAAPAVTLSPNPTAESVTVSADGAAITLVEVFAQDGTRFSSIQTDGAQSLAVDTSRWPQGSYMLRIHTTRGVATRKLAISR